MKTSSLHSVLAAASLVITPAALWAQTAPGTPQNPVPAPSPTQPTTEAQQPQRDPSRVDDAAYKPSGSTAAADISDSAREQFSKLDLNRDAMVSREEFAAFQDTDANPARDASSSTGSGRNGTGPGTPGSTTGSTGGVTGSSNDADRDVRHKSNAEKFMELDVNADGNLNIEEFARARPANIDAGRDASSSTGAGRNGTGPGTAGGTTGSTEGSTENINGKED